MQWSRHAATFAGFRRFVEFLGQFFGDPPRSDRGGCIRAGRIIKATVGDLLFRFFHARLLWFPGTKLLLLAIVVALVLDLVLFVMFILFYPYYRRSVVHLLFYFIN